MRLHGWEILKKICLVLSSKIDRLRDFSGGLFLSDFTKKSVYFYNQLLYTFIKRAAG